jgi:hypothetical protein|tara:strand:+ start:20244 stop:20540 length:297 start_codon:yes stop_codon:yes gene_type:complete
MSISFKQIDINTGSQDTHGMLVLSAGRLVAVLCRLDDVAHGDKRGTWHVETVFGMRQMPPETFPNLDSAAEWVRLSEDDPLPAFDGQPIASAMAAPKL